MAILYIEKQELFFSLDYLRLILLIIFYSLPLYFLFLFASMLISQYETNRETRSRSAIMLTSLIVLFSSCVSYGLYFLVIQEPFADFNLFANLNFISIIYSISTLFFFICLVMAAQEAHQHDKNLKKKK